MAIFNLTVSDSDFLVNKTTTETECSSTFTYNMQATNGDVINVSLSGSHINASYTLNGVKVNFTNGVLGIIFGTTLSFTFSIPNSGISGTFLESDIIITNTSSVNVNNAYEDTGIRYNDNINCDSINSNKESFMVALSDEVTDLVVATEVVTFRMPWTGTLIDIRSNVNTAPTDATLSIDVNKNALSVFSTKLTIDSGEKTSVTASAGVIISDTSFVDNDEITIDIDQVGSTIAGTGAKLTFYFIKT